MRHVNKSIALCVAAASATLLWASAAAQTPAGDPLGVVKIAKGEPAVIGYWLALTGPAGSLGIDSRRGIEMAIEAKGKLLDHPIRLVGEDSACTPNGASASATRLAANPALLAVIGPTCSFEALSGAPLLWKAGIATVSPSNTAVKLTATDRGPAFDGYLRTAHNDRVQGRVGAEFAFNALKATKVATVHDGSAYAQALVAAFTETFKRLGGSVIAQETIAPEQSNFEPLVDKLAAAKPELVYYPLLGRDASRVTRAARQLPALANTSLMSADGTFVPGFLSETGASAVGLYQSSPDLTPSRLGPNYTAFVAAYQKKYGEKPPSPYHAHAYDATRMILAALEKVATKDADGNTLVGRKALRDALFATRGFSGATGTLNCDANGDCADPKIAVYQVQSDDASTWDPGKNPRKIYP